MKKLVMVLAVFLGMAAALCAWEPGLYSVDIHLEPPIVDHFPSDDSFPDLVSELKYAVSVRNGGDEVGYFVCDGVRIDRDRFYDMGFDELMRFFYDTGFISSQAFTVSFDFSRSDDIVAFSNPVVVSSSCSDGEYSFYVVFRVNRDGSIVCPPMVMGSKFVEVE